MLLFSSLSTAVYSSCAFALAALVRLLFGTVFLSLLVSSLWMVSAEIHSLCCVFFLPRTSSHVSCQSFLQCSHCVSMSVASSSISSCSTWNLLAACMSLFLSSPTLHLVHVLLALVNLLRIETILGWGGGGGGGGVMKERVRSQSSENRRLIRFTCLKNYRLLDFIARTDDLFYDL